MKLKISFLISILFNNFCYAQNRLEDTSIISDEKSLVINFFKQFKFDLPEVNFSSLYTEIYKLKDIPYRYGGRSESGIDCSGFVKKIFNSVYNIELPGNSSKVIFQQTKNVKGEMKEGDLVFFKIKKNIISHVGIYLGNGKFAHASMHSGIIVSDLDEPYYKKYFYKATRVIQQNQ
jgi:murein DD-endopeptidase / murein LD-carboxypeptidase